jgi:hypothetical protein
VRIYADPGTQVYVDSYGGGSVTQGSAFMTVTGYLV